MISSLFLLLASLAPQASAQVCDNSNEFKVPFTSQVKMAPGDVMDFDVPETYKNKAISFVILGHRQDPSTHQGADPNGGKYDSLPGLTSFQVLNPNNEWRYWNGPGSGKGGAKFAEPRHELEMENLYEWRSYGHCQMDGSGCSTEALKPQKVRLVNVGTDNVFVGELRLKFYPEEPETVIQKIYTPGTEFNAQVGGKAKFGGGQNSKGLFPQAMVLNYSDLVVELPEGKDLIYFELIGGDSHPDQITNKDGGWGTPGWAKLSVGKGTSPDHIQWFMSNENVPPEGLLMSAPSDCHKKVKAGEKLYIRARSDNLYVMGYRISLK